LADKFELKDLGPPATYLGIDIKRDEVNGTISMSQERYLESLLRRFNM
jgi:hypothetical protein